MSLTEFGESIGRTLYRQIGRANGHVQNYRSLPVDVLEDDSSYLVVFDAPGTEPDDVQVRYLEGTVKIRIERFREYRDGFEMRFPGRGLTLDGEADLPSDAVVDPDAGTATLSESGTIRIEIPKESADGRDDEGQVDLDRTDVADVDGRPVEPTPTEELAVDD
ncbi:Hsp20/alpha crystallin family protein [Natrarchaeobius oligotrophus]|uniref:Hsp20/alpha crystallin family protein n=1 Tax=Natrarchaeobius chitinivorans TaxID=1679083 RepID=A0A3N6NSK6_NATCH|nr:Hsp20/alpha crystallin family protein [Natrarchaeobius chitinivorans]RQH03213.1 Hsp20/alpha crystallin family protein [Natrarchaeobius chitinivorans]